MDPILLDIPETLSTARLTLRVPRVGDGAAIAEAVRSSLAEVQPWMPWAVDNYGRDEGELWCRQARGKFHLRQQLVYVIFDPDTQVVLGGLGPHRIDWKQGESEIGYWLRTDRVGQGVMSEALNAVCAMLFDIAGLRRLEIRCDPRNDRSRAVAQRCGFLLEGTLRSNSLDPKDLPRDTHVLGRIRG